MNGLAETLVTESRVEVYAQSLSAIASLGSAVVSELVSIDTIENSSEYIESFSDFETAVMEHLSTDKDHGNRLVFSKKREFEHDGFNTLTATGVPVIELVQNGKLASRELADNDPEMESQFIRDEGDEIIALQVDRLEVGEVLHTVSMDPKEDLSKNPDKWLKLGYRPGMAVVQVYYRESEDSLLTWATCIKSSNKAAIAQIYRENYATDIPENQSSNTWIRNFAKYRAELSDAENIGFNIMKKHQQLVGDSVDYKSVADFLSENKSVLSDYFNSYIVPLAEATVTGRNNIAMESLALQILESVDQLTAESKSMLIKIGNNTKFNDDYSRFMEQIVRYATTSELKQKLPEFLKPTAEIGTMQDSHSIVSSVSASSFIRIESQRLIDMNMRMAISTNRAVKNNESWGGCSSANSHKNNGEIDNLGTLDVYGGKADSENNSSGAKDEFGLLEFECPKGHKNKREKGGWVYECQKPGCNEDVSCGKKKP